MKRTQGHVDVISKVGERDFIEWRWDGRESTGRVVDDSVELTILVDDSGQSGFDGLGLPYVASEEMPSASSSVNLLGDFLALDLPSGGNPDRPARFATGQGDSSPDSASSASDHDRFPILIF
jgi:hypothetical protein